MVIDDYSESVPTNDEDSTSQIVSAQVSLNDTSNDTINCSCKSSLPATNDIQDTSKTKTSSKKLGVCCLKRRCGAMLNKADFSDVTFIVGEEEEAEKFFAHKILLVAGSPIFKIMFSETWPKAGEIKISDLEPSAFFNVLSILYTDEVSLTPENVTGTWNAARKYAVLPLEEKCVAFLREHVCPENAFDFLIHAHMFDEQELVNLCLRIIDSNTSVAISADGFAEMDSRLLHLILARDALNVKEVDLFKAVLRWSEAECTRKNFLKTTKNKNLVMETALLLIRFPLMSFEEVSSTVVPACLPDETMLSIYKSISPNPHFPGLYNSNPRAYSRFKVCRLQEAFVRFYEQEPDTKLEEYIRFQVDRDVQLLGIGLNYSVEELKSTHLYLRQSLAPYNIIRGKRITWSDCRTGTKAEALFDSAVKLEAGANYLLHSIIQGASYFYQKMACSENTFLLPQNQTVTITYTVCALGGGENYRTVHGLIPDLIFST